MDDVRQRLVKCFTAVFAGLSAVDAPEATIDSVQAWDSSHHFLLLEVIEEEFGVGIPDEAAGDIDSFAGFEQHLSANA
jgi:acyl carrier protein